MKKYGMFFLLWYLIFFSKKVWATDREAHRLYTIFPLSNDLPSQDIYLGPSIDIYTYFSERLQRHKITRKIPSFIFKDLHKDSISTQSSNLGSLLESYQHWKIYEWRVMPQPLFNIDTNTWWAIFARIGNFFLSTKKSTIQKYIQEDTVDPIALQQMVYTLEKLPYIQKVNLEGQEVSEKQVSFFLKTQDRFPLVIEDFMVSKKKWGLIINNFHVLGLGHIWRNEFFYVRGKPLHQVMHYQVPNIGQHICLQYKYNHTEKRKKKKIKCIHAHIMRPYLWGLKINFDNKIPYQNMEKSFWLGRHFFQTPFEDTTLSLTGKVSHHAPHWKNTMRAYVLSLNSIGLWKQKKHHLYQLKCFGQKDQLSTGYQINFFTGYKKHMMKNQQDAVYFGSHLMKGFYQEEVGYLLAKAYAGSFLRNFFFDEFIHGFLKYMSPLLRWTQYATRLFTIVEYQRGFYFRDNLLFHISDDKFYKRMPYSHIVGTQYFHMGLEMVLFSRYNLIGFKIVPFLNLKNIFINHVDKNYLFSFANCYPAFTLGFRLYNDRLKLKSLVLSFVYDPKHLDYAFSGGSVKFFADKKFMIKEPKIKKK